MQSDMNSIAQGEVTPTPEIIAPRQNFDNREPSFVPESAGPMLTEEGAAPHKSHRGIFVIIAIVAVIALAAVGYFVIYPMMSSPVAEPIVEAPAQPAPATVTAPVVVTHTTAFSDPATPVPQVTLKLETVTRETIVQGLTDQGALVSNGLTEVVFQDAQGGQIPFPTLITALLPAFLDGQSAGSYTADDFTAYIHKDALGIWPGYIVTLKPEGTVTLNQWLASLEKTDLGALFVTEAGGLGAFKDGTVKGIADRFATGGTAGASLSYAVTATNLHLSTSYEGLKSTLEVLGY